MKSTAYSNLLAVKGICLLAVSLSVPAGAQNFTHLPAQVGPTMKADAMTAREKFDYRVIQSFGLHGYMGPAIGAAIGQARNSPREWGQGVGGFAIRYASGIGSNLSRQTMAFGLETALHEDPRYFPSEEKGFRRRLRNVLLQTVVARTDSGGETFAWARMGSAFGAGELANAWQPPSTRTPGRGLQRGVITLGGDLAYNFLQEFVPFVRPRGLRR